MFDEVWHGGWSDMVDELEGGKKQKRSAYLTIRVRVRGVRYGHVGGREHHLLQRGVSVLIWCMMGTHLRHW